ncbi:CRAL-TRIO domain-containing protein [Rhodocollybia butyracea]|uniref:CRAL-TRIO domain-containing protein n=1 Tax=Rhodocollybia butyracea TaxID=206335 RepID=A0A9P5PIV8_9AGAR|nr:CRAL-TRIO domain-containing protein [Rhodocollybia butyracea]
MSSFFFGSYKKDKESHSASTPDTPNTAGTTTTSSSTKSPSSVRSASPKPSTTKIQTTPAPGTKVGPIYEYDEKQLELMRLVTEYAHSISLPPSHPYAKWEQRWLRKADTIPRYSRASKWILNDAKKRMKGTMEWRREFQPELIVPEEVKIEDESGKILINGFDKDGRPIIYMRPGRQNTETSPRQLRHLVWCLERAKDLMPPGQESLVIIVDYKTTTLRTNPSVSVASKVLTILQHHYVETLGRAIVTNLPLLLSFFYKGISPFLDPVTRDKMRFNPDLLELIPASQLEAEFGGEYEYEFDHESYWNQLIQTCGIAPDGTRTNEIVPELDAPSSESSSPAHAHVASDATATVGSVEHAHTNETEDLEEDDSLSPTPATVVGSPAPQIPSADADAWEKKVEGRVMEMESVAPVVSA